MPLQAPPLLEVAAQHRQYREEFVLPLAAAAAGHVRAQMALHHLQDQPVDRAAHGCQLLQHGATFRVAFDGAFERGQLAVDAAHAGDQLPAVFLDVRHGDCLSSYTAGEYMTRARSMPAPDVSAFTHSHQFNHVDAKAERNTRRVVYITAAMMVVEIVGGYALNSMALLADGWHMSSHALAMGLSVMAYVFARRYAKDRRFAFGTWKIEILGGYSSALLLAVVAALMMIQSVERLFAPSAIHYDEAILIAVIGLGVNLLCAWLLKGEHHHGHAHSHDHGHGHDHSHDVNLRAAYLHVIADAATSVLAIVALVGGKLYGASWLDPVMGIVGSILVARWAFGLLRESGRILLDAEMDQPVVDEIRDVVRDQFATAAVSDLHVWRVGRDSYACILGLVATSAISAEEVRRQLAVHEELVHVTVEVAVA